MSTPLVAIVVVAAGSGARLGSDLPKAFVELDGMTILERSLIGIQRSEVIAQLVVVVPSDRRAEASAIVSRVCGDAASGFATVVAGGAERVHSVIAGLAALLPSVQTVLVHDAARPLTPPGVFDAVTAAVVELGVGAVPTIPVVDTVKRIAPDGGVRETLDRSDLVAVQTPQGFPRAFIEDAYAAAGLAATSYTDDAAIVAAAGHPVIALDGSELAFKITVRSDLARAAALIRGSDLRTGIGVDVHAFEAGVPLWLGGVLWPESEVGLAGHSDGDAASHAIVDALLQAAGLGDIGSVFGTSDPRFAGASGATFIGEALQLVSDAGWSVRGVSVEIVANEPKIGPRRAELERVLSGLVGAPVTVAGTTSDGLGLTGSGDGVAAIATALLTR